MATTATVQSAQAKIAFAQNVELKVGSVSFTFMRNVEMGFTRPETRYAHGLTRTYGHGPPDAEITFTVSANAGAYAYIMSRSEKATAVAPQTSGDIEYGKVTRGVLSEHEWEIKLSGDDGQTETLKMKGKLRDVTMRKPDGDNSEVVDLDCYVRITDETIQVTNAGG